VKVAVLIKQTPDTAELPKVSAQEVQSGAVKATMVINPWDEYAAEEAIQLGDRYGADSVAITMGASTATDALKHALAMGIGEAKLIDSSGVSGDMWTTASILAAAVRAEGDVDLVITGKQSVDENSSSVFIGVACKLGFPLAANVVRIVEIAGGRITVERIADGVQETVSLPLPAVISVGKEINDPRFPSFMGIRKANRASIPVVSAAGLDAGELVKRTNWTNIRKPDEKTEACVIFDGATAADKAAKLVDALVADKVL
jgi:electron transfer flavoprotein beta subunit